MQRNERNKRISHSDKRRRDFVGNVKKLRATTSRLRWRGAVRWSFFLVFAVLFSAGAVFSYERLADKFFYSNPDYNLRKIEVEGADVLTADEVEILTGKIIGTNLFRIHLGVLEEEFRKIPELTKVYLTRELPDTIRVTLEARVPVAWVTDEAEGKMGAPEFLVDDDVVVYKPHRVQAADYALPVISGARLEAIARGDLLLKEDLREALTLLQTLRYTPESTFEIRGIDISKGYCMEAVDSKNMKVLFDIGNYPGQLAKLQKLLAHCGESGRVLETVNLIPKRNTPVRFAMANPPPPSRGEAPKTKR